jgi:hypothetical protein
MIPLLRRKIALLKYPQHTTCRVFRAIYTELMNRKKRGLEPLVINKSLIRQNLKDLKDSAVTLAFTTLENDGWLIYRGMGNYEPSPFTLYLGSILEEEKEIEYEGETRIKELIAEKEDSIRKLAQTFKTYPGINEERIKKWLLQFPSRGYAEVALKLLEHVEYIDQQKMREFLQDFYEKLTQNDKENAAFVILGRLGDSSDLISYYFTHLEKKTEPLKEKGLKISKLEDVLTRGSAKIIFFLEDCLLTGTQSKQIFDEWLGVVPSSKYVTKLTDAQIIRLKQLDIRIHAIVGTEEGMKDLAAHLQKHGCRVRITANRILKRESDSCFVWGSNFSKEFSSKDELEKTKKEFQGLGKKILHDRAAREDWTAQQLDENCLGYGNWQLLLVFQHNTPTATIPIFWEHAYINGKEWVPLFPRK